MNSIATVKGGSHVNHITNQITDHLIKANLQAVHVKNYLWVFVNALIDDPVFDSEAGQETLIQPNSFESQFKLPERFLEKGM